MESSSLTRSLAVTGSRPTWKPYGSVSRRLLTLRGRLSDLVVLWDLVVGFRCRFGEPFSCLGIDTRRRDDGGCGGGRRGGRCGHAGGGDGAVGGVRDCRAA